MAKRGQQKQGYPPYTFFFSMKSSEFTNKLMTWGVGDVLFPCVTGEEKRQRATFITQATDLLYLQNRSEDFVRFSLLVSTSVFVYGTSLVIPLKYFGVDVQRRNDKFERIILVNLRLAVHAEKRSLKKFSTEKKG